MSQKKKCANRRRRRNLTSPPSHCLLRVLRKKYNHYVTHNHVQQETQTILVLDKARSEMTMLYTNIHMVERKITNVLLRGWIASVCPNSQCQYQNFGHAFGNFVRAPHTRILFRNAEAIEICVCKRNKQLKIVLLWPFYTFVRLYSMVYSIGLQAYNTFRKFWHFICAIITFYAVFLSFFSFILPPDFSLFLLSYI